MQKQVNLITTSIRDFLAPAMALASAGYIDDVSFLWAAYSVREEWVAGLSVEDRAEFLNFNEVFISSVATTTLGTGNTVVQHEEQEYLISNDSWEDECPCGCGINPVTDPDAYTEEHADSRHDDHIRQLWEGQP